MSLQTEVFQARQAFVMRERRYPTQAELERERVRRAWAEIHRQQMARPSLRPSQ